MKTDYGSVSEVGCHQGWRQPHRSDITSVTGKNKLGPGLIGSTEINWNQNGREERAGFLNNVICELTPKDNREVSHMNAEADREDFSQEK